MPARGDRIVPARGDRIVIAAEAGHARALFAGWQAGPGLCPLKPSARRAAEALAVELTESLLWPRSTIIDAGCGTGRMARRWLADKHRVTGIEGDPDLVAALCDQDWPSTFTLVEQSIDDAEMPVGGVDLVTAFDSLQHAADPAACVARFADWVRPGGAVCVQVDSLLALHGELVREGQESEADNLLITRRGRTAEAVRGADVHLFTAATLKEMFRAAGLVDVQVRGLVVGASLWGRIGVAARMRHNEEEYLALERSFWKEAALADQGLHLFASGRRPRATHELW